MRVFHDDPLFLRFFHDPLVLKGSGGVSLRYRVPEIDRILQDVCHCDLCPGTGMLHPLIGNILSILVHQECSRRRDFLVLQCFRDPVAAHSLKRHLKHPLYDLGMFIRNQMMPVLRISGIAVSRKRTGIFSLQSLYPECGPDLPAAVLCIPLVDNVLKRCELIVALIRIHAVVDRDEPDLVFRKDDLCIIACLQIIPAQTGKVFDNYSANLALLDKRDHSLEIRTVEIRSRIAVVNEELAVLKAIFLCILGKHAFLRLNTDAVTTVFIIPA